MKVRIEVIIYSTITYVNGRYQGGISYGPIKEKYPYE